MNRLTTSSKLKSDIESKSFLPKETSNTKIIRTG